MVAPHDQVTHAVSANIVFETVVLHRFQARYYGLQTLAPGSATEGSTRTNEETAGPQTCLTMATQKCPRCDQNGAKGNGNDLNVYVNGSGIVPHAFRIARIPTPSGGGHAVSFSMRILRFFFFWPLLVPVFWRKAALPKSPGLHAGDIQGPPKRQRGFFYGLALDPFVSVHGKT